jgi:Na+/proline symporter/nitrogen-specific signal transduction histidine kinase
MSVSIFIIAAIAYIGLLFLIAYYTERKSEQGKSWVNNSYVYALSLAVYCTAWTFYGSVGKAAKSGLGFLPIYLGPTLLAPLWLLILRKIIVISKAQRITSIADFISSRYGKSTYLGVLVTIMAFIGIIPYISLQLKAITDSFMILVRSSFVTDTEGVFNNNATFLIAMVLTLFTILFGMRKADPNERHEGLVNAIAFESIVKLVAFLAVGVFVTYGLHNGFSDLFQKATTNAKAAKLLYLGEGITSTEWFWLSVLSALAVLFLPRQFHIAVVENINPNHITKAMWLFPLYMLGINVFVLPITVAGILQFGESTIRPDTYVLELPLENAQPFLALLVFIGGLSAAASMVIVETMALSIMLSNHIMMPPLVKTLSRRDNQAANFSQWLINVRRACIFIIMLLAFFYVDTLASNRELVSIGLVSFTAVAQFAPALLGGLFWKNGTAKAAFAALSIGFMIWVLTLSLPTLAEYGLISKAIFTEGYFGVSILKPYALFGLEGFDQISHAAFWSLTLNTLTYIGVSLYTKQTATEAAQADFFVNIYKYQKHGSELEVQRREAKIDDLVFLMTRFLGDDRAFYIMQNYERESGVSLGKMVKASEDFIKYVETQLAGALGASSAKVLVGTVAKEDPISLEEMLHVLDQTQEVIITNKMLENKSKELEATTRQLQVANEQLQELDRLKADFITTVTHELRTPMTSIKALSKILLDNKDLERKKRDEFLSIIVNETERITRLINQVLDIEKLESQRADWHVEQFNLTDLVVKTFKAFTPTFEEKRIERILDLHNQRITINGDRDKITQVIVNLISNAVKFTNTEGGLIVVELFRQNGKAVIKVADNGKGIPLDKQTLIFERFTQISDPQMGKPVGSGLGLYISKSIVEYHRGTIGVDSQQGEGTTFWVKLPIDI